MAIKVLPFFREVDPQASMPADGAGSLDDETKEITFISRRREINVSSRYIGRAIILQWQEIDMAWGGHDDRRGMMEILRQ
jgi:hypothetical protein